MSDVLEMPGVALPDVFLPYQQEFMQMVDENDVVVVEKGRRTGFSWTAAAIAALVAGAAPSANGMDVFYLAYDQDMTRGFIDDAKSWITSLQPAVEDIGIEEGFFVDPDNPEKEFRTYRITLASGFEINALPSVARALRSKQGLVIFDEAAFADDPEGILKAAFALLMWGGKVVIISTHNGTANYFNTLINDIRAGNKPYKLMRVTLDDALAQGLYKRICLKTKDTWSPENEVAWRAKMFAVYGANADEELLAIPADGEGAYLSAIAIERAQRAEIPVIRLELPSSFLMMSERLRIAEIEEFCERELKPILRKLDPNTPHAFGQDFARSFDLSVFWPLAIGRDLVLRTPFVLEMRNVPYEAQKQIVFYIIDRLPRFRAGKFDAGGNGEYLAEVSLQKYGERIECVKFSEPWYRENMPRWKSAFDEGAILIPKDREIQDDHRLVRLIRGVGRVPDQRTGEKGKRRHGDSAVAGALAVAASRAEPEIYDYEGAPAVTPAAGGGDGWYRTAEEANRADDESHNAGGFMPALTRRVY